MPSIAACTSPNFARKAGQVAGLPVLAFVADFQVGEELPFQRGQHFHQGHVPLDGPELRFHPAPRRLGELPLLGRLDLHEPDQPALGRDQEAGGFLARKQFERDAADHPRRLLPSPFGSGRFSLSLWERGRG